MVDVGLILAPDQPPERYREVAMAADAAGIDELWVWEDCFAQSGVAAAAAALASTARIRVGIGLMPAPLRAVALEAMEVATLARLFPGRLLPGFGHGVQEWMGQAGVRAASPMTLLREHLEALRPLLAGRAVSVDGRAVRLDDVRLRWPPTEPVPLLVGATRERSLALAGELGDGVILTDGHDVDVVAERMRHVRAAWQRAGREGEPASVVFLGDLWGTGAEALAQHVRALESVGATSVAVFHADEPGGAPIGDARILESVAIVADAQRLLRR